jgi:hypothetical protein
LQYFKAGKQIPRIIRGSVAAFEFSDNVPLLSNMALSIGDLLRDLCQALLKSGPISFVSAHIKDALEPLSVWVVPRVKVSPITIIGAMERCNCHQVMLPSTI